MKNSNFKISIITVSFNSAKTIEKTILSVLNQTYKNIEYIIIDGGSTDGTVDIIKKYSDKITYWVSEKDNGIYDAMNKGAAVARGNYLNFMNSDDYFFDKNVLHDINLYCDKKYDIIYGGTEIRNKNSTIIQSPKNIKNLWKGSINHQSTFIKRQLLKKYKYNIQNEIVADFEFFLNAYYKEKSLFKRIKRTIASYSNMGISNRNPYKTFTDNFVTIKKFRKNIFILLYYKTKIIKYNIKKLLKKIIFYSN